MSILIIDTSTERSQVIFAETVNHFFAEQFPVGFRSSSFLMSVIEKHNPSPEAIAVTVGPGSFTGIRVGVAAAKGIAFARKIPLISLSALSGFISPKEERFLSLIDARGAGVYTLLQERKEGEIRALSQPQLTSLEELSLQLGACRSVVGPNLARFDLLGGYECYADPAHLVKLAYQKREDGALNSNQELLLNY